MDIIFDLDGTLWDSTKVIKDAWNEVFSHNNLEEISEDELKSVFGLDMKKIIQTLKPNASEDILFDLIEKEHEYLRRHRGLAYKNTVSTIKELSKNNRLFIVSNCQKGYIELFLDSYDLRDYIVDFMCWGDTLSMKGITLEKIMERNDIKNTCYIGDTSGDKSAADYAGIPFIYAAYGFGYVEDYVYRIDDIKEVIGLLDKGVLDVF